MHNISDFIKRYTSQCFVETINFLVEQRLKAIAVSKTLDIWLAKPLISIIVSYTNVDNGIPYYYLDFDKGSDFYHFILPMGLRRSLEIVDYFNSHLEASAEFVGPEFIPNTCHLGMKIRISNEVLLHPVFLNDFEAAIKNFSSNELKKYRMQDYLQSIDDLIGKMTSKKSSPFSFFRSLAIAPQLITKLKILIQYVADFGLDNQHYLEGMLKDINKDIVAFEHESERSKEDKKFMPWLHVCTDRNPARVPHHVLRKALKNIESLVIEKPKAMPRTAIL